MNKPLPKNVQMESVHGDVTMNLGASLTKRESFVKAAMQGFLSNPFMYQKLIEVNQPHEIEALLAVGAIAHADAVLAALEPAEDTDA